MSRPSLLLVSACAWFVFANSCAGEGERPDIAVDLVSVDAGVFSDTGMERLEDGGVPDGGGYRRDAGIVAMDASDIQYIDAGVQGGADSGNESDAEDGGTDIDAGMAGTALDGGVTQWSYSSGGVEYLCCDASLSPSCCIAFAVGSGDASDCVCDLNWNPAHLVCPTYVGVCQ